MTTNTITNVTLSALPYDPGTGILHGMWLFTLADGSTCIPRHCGRVVDGVAIDPVPGEALRYIVAAGMPVASAWRVDEQEMASLDSGSEPEDEEVESPEEAELRERDAAEDEKVRAGLSEFFDRAVAGFEMAATAEEFAELAERVLPFVREIETRGFDVAAQKTRLASSMADASSRIRSAKAPEPVEADAAGGPEPTSEPAPESKQAEASVQPAKAPESETSETSKHRRPRR